MENYQKTILQLMSSHPPISLQTDANWPMDLFLWTVGSVDTKTLAQTYVNSGFFEAAMKYIQDYLWLLNKKKCPEIEFVNLIEHEVLSPIFYLGEFLENRKLVEIKKLSKQSVFLAESCLNAVLLRSIDEQKIFAKVALFEMSKLFEHESKMQTVKNKTDHIISLSLYRIFDSLDNLFQLNYDLDLPFRHDLNIKERVYEGAGVGVQSGYSSILTALTHLAPKAGASFVDLGSGYGRIGMVVGLMRPDILFKGYEYVEHRVACSNYSSKMFDLQEHIQFHKQDLSSNIFKIPQADIYYMYDPFNESTYNYVLNQLVNIGRQQNITIATKGNAKSRLDELARQEGWTQAEEFDNGNLCIYRNHPKS